MLERLKQLLGIKKKPEPELPTVRTILAKYAEMMENDADNPTVQDTKQQLAHAMIEPLLPKWKPAPEGTICVACGSSEVERSHIMVGGPFSGSVRCKACGWAESVMSNIARNCIKIEPLSPVALPVYGEAMITSAINEVVDTDLFMALEEVGEEMMATNPKWVFRYGGLEMYMTLPNGAQVEVHSICAGKRNPDLSPGKNGPHPDDFVALLESEENGAGFSIGPEVLRTHSHNSRWDEDRRAWVLDVMLCYPNGY